MKRGRGNKKGEMWFQLLSSKVKSQHNQPSDHHSAKTFFFFNVAHVEYLSLHSSTWLCSINAYPVLISFAFFSPPSNIFFFSSTRKTLIISGCLPPTISGYFRG